MEEDSLFPGQPSHRGQVLNRTGLVVGMHDGDEDRVLTNRRVQVLKADQPLTVHRQVGHLESFLLQLLHGPQDRGMLDGGGDEVPPFLGVAGGDSPDGGVVGLGPPAGEDDLLGQAADEIGDPLPGGLHRLAGLLSEFVNRRGVAEVLEKVRRHGLQHPWIHSRRGVVVQVDSPHCRLFSRSALLNSQDSEVFTPLPAIDLDSPWNRSY